MSQPDGEPSPDYPPREAIKLGDEWFVVNGQLGETPIILRARQNLKPIAGHPDYPTRLTVVWTFRGEVILGFPGEAETEALTDFEDRLEPALREDNLALLTAVVTHGGTRQWLFYTTDAIEAQQRLKRVFEGEPPFPIELASTQDPTWRDYLAVLETLENADLQ